MIVQCRVRSKMLTCVGEGLLSVVGGLVLGWMLCHHSSDECIIVVVLWRPG
jgi:hypothetical protein